MKQIITIFLAILFSPIVSAGHPDCSGEKRWATVSAFVHLKNAGITNNDSLDFDKTITTRLASEKAGEDLYIQIHHVIFTEKSGKIIEVITENEASNEECSMSGVRVFVVNQVLGGK